MIKVVTIDKKIKPKIIESNKIFNGDDKNVGSSEPTPINSFITLFKKYASNTH